MENHSVAAFALSFFLGGFGLAPQNKVEVTTNETRAVVGKETSVRIGLTVAKGFHIQSNPTSDPTLIATTLEIEPHASLQIGAPVYPKGKPHRLQSGKELSTYEGQVDVFLPVTPKAAGSFNLKGTLRYQACDAKSCFFPMTAPWTVTLRVLNDR